MDDVKPPSGVVDRSRLRPELRRMIEEAEASGGRPVEAQTPAEARASSELRLGSQWGLRDEVADIRTFIVEGPEGRFRARLYRPAGRRTGTILYLHGGGWVVGSLDTHDGAIRAMALAAGADILSVEYRKAPEAPFPAALLDATVAHDWLLENGASLGFDTKSVVIAGDSAGATLAAALAGRARCRDRGFAGQVLVYPATDLAGGTDSRRLFATGFSLNITTLDWFTGHYLAGGVRADHPEVSPLRARDLSGLPPALLVTADHDPLRDEGRAFAQRLIAAGNHVAYEEWQGTVHGFMLMDRITPAARALIAGIGIWCRNLWSR